MSDQRPEWDDEPALLEELGEPLMSVSLILPGDEEPMTDPYEIRQRLEHHVDLIIDGGFGDLKASTVIDLTGEGAVRDFDAGDSLAHGMLFPLRM